MLLPYYFLCTVLLFGQNDQTFLILLGSELREFTSP